MAVVLVWIEGLLFACVCTNFVFMCLLTVLFRFNYFDACGLRVWVLKCFV